MEVDSTDQKTAYLSCMSHEIRAILSIIMGACDMAKYHIDDKYKLIDCLEKISKSTYEMLTITDCLMEMGKNKKAEVTVMQEDFFIDELACEIKTLLEPLAEEKNIKLEVAFNNVSTRNVTSDYGQLLHMLINIATNAIKYTPGGGEVRLVLEENVCDDSRFAHYRISCHDTGIGIPDEFLEHIYEPFSRADDERVAGIKGTGLGMMIVKEIVEKLGGKIHIDSTVDVGTTVVIDLNLLKADID